MTQFQLIDFFTARPALNLKAFAEECEISQTLLYYIVTNKRKLQPYQVEKILPVAKKYGYGG